VMVNDRDDDAKGNGPLLGCHREFFHPLQGRSRTPGTLRRGDVWAFRSTLSEANIGVNEEVLL
jgi:hypothetical protein